MNVTERGHRTALPDLGQGSTSLCQSPALYKTLLLPQAAALCLKPHSHQKDVLLLGEGIDEVDDVGVRRQLTQDLDLAQRRHVHTLGCGKCDVEPLGRQGRMAWLQDISQ